MSLPSSQDEPSPIRNQVLYYGDLVGMRHGHRGHVIGQIQGGGHPTLVNVERYSHKPHWPMLRLFNVQWQGSSELTTYNRNTQSVMDSMVILNRPYIRVGNTVGKEGCQSVTGQVISVEPLVTVALVDHPHVLVMDVPLRRLAQQNVSPVNQKFIYENYIGVLVSVKYDVTLRLVNPSDTCTANIEVPNDQHHRLGLAQALQWEFATLINGVWGKSTSLLTAAAKSLIHSGYPGKISALRITSGFVKWARNIRTGETVQNTTLTFEGSLVRFFGIANDLDLAGEYSLILTGQDHLSTVDCWETHTFGRHVGPPPPKNPRLNNAIPTLHGPHRVKIHIIQNKLGVNWTLNDDDTMQEEILSSKVRDIQESNTVEIATNIFVLHRFPTRATKNLIGVTRAFPGELDLTLTNPQLNSSNLVEVAWMTLETDELRIDHESTMTCFELVSVDISQVTSAILVVDSRGVTPLVASFVKILDNGMLQLVDSHGTFVEKWPSAIEIHTDTEIRELCFLLREQMAANANDLRLEGEKNESTFDFNLQVPTMTILRDCPMTSVPVNVVNESNLESHLDRLRILTGERPGYWIFSYAERQDLFSVVFPGRNGSDYSDMAFLLHFQFPAMFPINPPTLIVSPETTINQSLTPLLLKRIENFLEQNRVPVDSLQTFLLSIKELMTSDIMDPTEMANFTIVDQGHATPLTHLYDENQLTDDEWVSRWTEIRRIQAIELVFRNVKTESHFQVKTQVGGHYRRLIQTFICRWKGWAEEEGVSEGFKETIKNVVKSLESNDDDEDKKDEDEDKDDDDGGDEEMPQRDPDSEVPPLVPGQPDTSVVISDNESDT